MADTPNENATFELGVDIRIELECNISLCGVIGYLVNYDEAVYITCFLLPFVNGTRLSSVDKSKEQLIISCTKENGWTSMSWEIDDYGEWESYTDDERWRKT